MQSTENDPLATEVPQVKRNALGQVISSSGPNGPTGIDLDGAQPRPPISEDWSRQAHEYLTDKGWEFNGSMWRDPQSAGSTRGVQTEVKMLPDKDVGEKPLVQTICPVARWDLSTEEAVATQRRRDSAGTVGSPLERIDGLSRTIDATIRAQGRLAHDLEQLLGRSIPERQDLLNAEVRFLRQAIRNAAGRLKSMNVQRSEVA